MQIINALLTYFITFITFIKPTYFTVEGRRFYQLHGSVFGKTEIFRSYTNYLVNLYFYCHYVVVAKLSHVLVTVVGYVVIRWCEVDD